MDSDSSRDSSSGRWIPAETQGIRYAAFVPAPLPPVLPLDGELFRVASNAAYALGELAALGRGLANPHLLLGPFLRKEAVLSSRIEGTQAGIADLYAYEAGQVLAAARIPGVEMADDVQEVLNYVRALEFGIAQLAEAPLDLNLIRAVHGRLMQGVRGGAAKPGEFRSVQNWIGRHGASLRAADYVPPPPEEMPAALDALAGYLQGFTDDHPPLVRLAFIHYQFEAIHPFLDGNGRMGRLLISLLLHSWQLLPLPLLYLSAYFESHRATYYDLLLAVSRRNAWRDWTIFFLQGVLEQARDASDRARRLNDLRSEWRDRLTAARASAHALALAESLFVSPMLNIPQAQKLLDVAYPTAQRSIEKLVEAGILQQAGEQHYGKSFAAGEILAVVGEPLFD
jgi:Fic family protein